jgi:hypothetical protein
MSGDSPQSVDGGTTRGERWAFAGLALLSFCLIAGCWDAGFTGRDDDRYVVRNPVVNGKAPIWTAFSDSSLELYIPTIVVSFRLDNALFYGLKSTSLGTWAPGCRFMTVLYHILAGFIVWRWILPKLGANGLARTFVTGIFLLHPSQCESVCWIAERKTVFGGLFGAAAMAFYFRAAEASGMRAAKWMVAAIVAFALALMSKITALGILPVLFCWEILFGPDAVGMSTTPPGPPLLRGGKREGDALGHSFMDKLKRIVARQVLLAIVALPLLWVNWEAAKDQFGIRIGANVFESLLTDVEILARYLQVLVWPPNSSPYYELLPIASPFSVRFLIAAAGFFGPVVLTVWLPTTNEARRRVLFGWLWFVGAMSLALNLAAQPEFMHDRYMYFSIPGVALAIVTALQGLAERVKLKLSRSMLASAVGLVCLILALSAVQIGFDWGSEILTFGRSARVEPGSSSSHGYLANALGVAANVIEDQAGDHTQAKEWREKALEHFKIACAAPDIQYNLRRVRFWMGRAFIAEKLGRPGESREILQTLFTVAKERQWTAPGDLLNLQKAGEMLKALPRE